MKRVVAVMCPLLCAAVGLAGCGSGGSGARASSSTGASGATSTSATASNLPTTSAAPADTTPESVKLAARLKTGVEGVSSAHVDMHIGAAGQLVTGAGDETLSAGKLTAMDLTEQIGAVSIRVLIVGNVVYVQLPPTLNTTGKPWLRASATSTNPVLKQLSTSISSAQQSASIDSATQFVAAAQSTTLVGHDTVDGQPADHYAVTVDLAKLAAAQVNAQALAATGLTTIPVQVWINEQDRPVKVTEDLAVQGQKFSVLVTVSKYNAPVTITAPPADQIGSE